MNEPIQIFHFVTNGFYVFGNKFFSKKKQVLHNFAIFLFVYLLLIFIIEWAQDIISVSDKRAIEHTLGAKVWLYGFQSIF